MFYYTKCFANESAIRRLTLITMSTYFEVQRPRLTHIGNYNNLWILIKMFTFFNSADLRQFSNVSSQLLFLGVQRFKVFATRERILDPKKCRKSSESRRNLSFSNRLVVQIHKVKSKFRQITRPRFAIRKKLDNCVLFEVEYQVESGVITRLE